ncbi:MAG: GH3 auxin-responsive promoter family protein [Flavobacteriales bacterium]|nr:GH3 auxin-responsive promoter family protein [Flavobacteriales bacterium]
MPFNSIFTWMMKKRIHQIDLFRKYPHQVQEELFGNLIRKSITTTYGAINDFGMVNSYEDYRKNIPLQTYDNAKLWIDRAMEGEKSLLWPEETKWFAKSSGTTSKSKFIPVTKEALEDCHYKGGKDLLAMYYDLHPNRKLYNSKHLIIGGSAEINQLSEDSYFGDLSAIIVKNLPWYIERRRTPSREIALMTNWEEKIENMAESTIKEDVCIIAGVPSWTMVLANKVLEITGKKNLKEVWPNLELFMHGGVSFEPYREEFKRLIPDPEMNYVQTYNASEGFFGIQDQKDSDEMLLMLDYGIFYEFIPMDDFDGVNSKRVLNLREVELGVNYALVITTNAGLWRYILGDTIKFTSLLPFRFKITGRVGSFINCFGEELIVENSDVAIAEASKSTGAQIKEYSVAPIFMDGTNKGSHEWLIEFTTEPDSLEMFTSVLDQALCKLNSDYEAKRTNNMVLKLPVVRIAARGTFDMWLNDNKKLGGQNKIPRLRNDRSLLEQLLQIDGMKSLKK